MEKKGAGEPVDFAQEMERHSRISILTMVLGIAGLTLAFVPMLVLPALLVCAAALVTGLLLRRYTRRINIPEDKKNAAGRWCGLIGLLLCLLTVVLFVVALVGAGDAGGAPLPS